ncbi:MAG: PA14 domain-containing protein, partial [Lactobacillus sp.]|nr:PA14 domain-containing protein [Lactobacillus sp.]
MVTLPNGIVFNSNHFLFEYTSYFTPTQSGLYKFQLINVDDGAAIFLGNGAFNCCAPSASGNLPNSVNSLLTVGYLNGPQSGSTGYVYLQGGLYFPFRLVYVNIDTKAWFNFSIVQPDGTTINNFSNIVFVPNFAGACSATTVTQTTIFTTTIPTATKTTVITSTVTQQNGATYPVQIEVVPPLITTVTSGTVLTTFTSTVTNPTTTFVEVVVQIPYSTTTIGSAVPSKYTTLTTTTIGTSVITEYVVITPYPTTTITSGTFNTPISYVTTMTLAGTTFTGEVIQMPHSTTTVGSLVPSLFTTLVTTTVSGTVLTT